MLIDVVAERSSKPQASAAPEVVDGHQSKKPIEGISFRLHLRRQEREGADGGTRTQYFEMMGQWAPL